MAQTFIQNGNQYRLIEANFSTNPILETAIYDLRFDQLKQELYLEKTGDKFHFGYKLYGLDYCLINHVLNGYRKSPIKKNMGVLLNGVKGTGKTVTAKYLANELDLPIITVSAAFPGLATFISSIRQDVVFFFDEFEKNFHGGKNEFDEEVGGESLLSVMDGVNNTGFAHIFLLTTNELRLNQNFLSRPSRIRYLKTFEDVMTIDLLNEIIDDFLVDKSKKKELIDYITTLEYATIDIVKSIIEEVNIHECSVDDFKEFFNVSVSNYKYCYHYTYFYVGEEDTKYTTEDFIEDASHPHDNSKNKRRLYYNTREDHHKLTDYVVGYTFQGDTIEYLDQDEKIMVTFDPYSQRKTFYKFTCIIQDKLYNSVI